VEEIESLFRHVLISLVAIASHDKYPYVHEFETDDYKELVADIEDMRDSLLSTVYEEGEDSFALEEVPPPLLHEAQQVFAKCLKHFVHGRYQ